MLADPERECWLAESEGRTYWRYLGEANGPFRFDRLAARAPCPFGGGLYQLMCNRVLAHALVRHGGADWADVALCIHPGNDAVDALDEPVAGTSSGQAAFTSLLRSAEGFFELRPKAIIEATPAACPDLASWGEWGRERYQV